MATRPQIPMEFYRLTCISRKAHRIRQAGIVPGNWGASPWQSVPELVSPSEGNETTLPGTYRLTRFPSKPTQRTSSIARDKRTRFALVSAHPKVSRCLPDRLRQVENVLASELPVHVPAWVHVAFGSHPVHAARGSVVFRPWTNEVMSRPGVHHPAFIHNCAPANE